MAWNCDCHLLYRRGIDFNRLAVHTGRSTCNLPATEFELLDNVGNFLKTVHIFELFASRMRNNQKRRTLKKYDFVRFANGAETI